MAQSKSIQIPRNIRVEFNDSHKWQWQFLSHYTSQLDPIGFAKDYQETIVNAKHELILTRSNTDRIAITQTVQAMYRQKLVWIFLINKDWVVDANYRSVKRKEGQFLEISWKWLGIEDQFSILGIIRLSRNRFGLSTHWVSWKNLDTWLAFQTARNHKL